MSGGRRNPGYAHPLITQLAQAVPPGKAYVIGIESGYSHAWLHQILRGERCPNVWGLTALADTLGYEVVLVKKESKAA